MENNKIDEAEKVLRNAIKACPHEFRRWELHLTLCQLLTQLGDETDDALFYEEALKEISTVAGMIKPDHPILDFHGGIVRFKIGDYRGSLKNFQRCLRKLEKDKNRDKRYTEAELNARRVRFLMDREKAQSKTSKIASIFLISVFLIHLIAIWTLRLLEKGNISDTILTVLVPILLGLIVIATLLPWLSRLKMTGLEAELSVSEPKPKETIASGRKGEIGFGSALGTFR